MSTVTMTGDQAYEWIKRAIELGKYDVARGILEDVIKSKIKYENEQEKKNLDL